jgi:DNA (cytosine-5)-methyltransferase 1
VIPGLGIGSLFSGYGGLDMGIQAALGGSVAWTVENADAPSAILAHHSPTTPNLGDITTVPWHDVEAVDILAGGFPCQDVSVMGARRGIRPDTRSGLWSHYGYAIDALRPSLVIIENVKGLLSADAHSDLERCPWCLGNDGTERHLRALGAVLGDLARLGYDTRWTGIRASDAGAPHERFRVFLVAYPAHKGLEGWSLLPQRPGQRDTLPSRVGVAPDAHDILSAGRRTSWRGLTEPTDHNRGVDWRRFGRAIERWERVVGRAAPDPMTDGRLSARFTEWMMGLPDGYVTSPAIGLSHNQQVHAIGNGVVPQQAELALRHLLG